MFFNYKSYKSFKLNIFQTHYLLKYDQYYSKTYLSLFLFVNYNFKYFVTNYYYLDLIKISYFYKNYKLITTNIYYSLINLFNINKLI